MFRRARKCRRGLASEEDVHGYEPCTQDVSVATPKAAVTPCVLNVRPVAAHTEKLPAESGHPPRGRERPRHKPDCLVTAYFPWCKVVSSCQLPRGWRVISGKNISQLTGCFSPFQK